MLAEIKISVLFFDEHMSKENWTLTVKVVLHRLQNSHLEETFKFFQPEPDTKSKSKKRKVLLLVIIPAFTHLIFNEGRMNVGERKSSS